MPKNDRYQLIRTIYYRILSTYKRSTSTFKWIMWSYISLGCISILITDYVYALFSAVLLLLIFNGEYKYQECKACYREIKILHDVIDRRGSYNDFHTNK